MFNRLYLHIPFCQRKCDYCAFVSMKSDQHAIDTYVETLLGEMRLARTEYGAGAGLDSIYLGGGTPSLLSPHQVARLLERTSHLFGWTTGPEITLEANPGTVDIQRLAGFRAAGVNRLSLGVQTFDDSMLASLGRIHTGEEVLETVATAREAGFDNLGLDLIHTLPGQTPEMWRNDLLQALQCEPEHISVYGLTIEEGTSFSHRYPADSPLLPDEDVSADMFEIADATLTAAGYEHYELANYARPGFRSRHNSGYWKRDGYLGLGLASHSFLKKGSYGVRFSTTIDMVDYAAAISSGKLPHRDMTPLTREDAMAEFMFLGLRLAEGIRFRDFEDSFGTSLLEVYAPAFEMLAKAGLIMVDAKGVRLTLPGMLLSNQVFSRFLP